MKHDANYLLFDYLYLIEKKKARGRALKQSVGLRECIRLIIEKKKARGRALKHCIFRSLRIFASLIEKKKARGRALKHNHIFLLLSPPINRKEESPR